MKCIHTASGVLMIVGMGYLAGVGQALLRDRPVILGTVSTPAQTMPTTPNAGEPNESAQMDPAQVPDSDLGQSSENNANDIKPAGSNPADEFDARLDAPVPDGMLTLRQAHQMWIDGAYFIDSRHKEEYDHGHVSGAAHLTAETFFTKAGEAEIQTIPPDAPVVIYCLGGDQCEASLNTKALLEQSFFTDLHIMGVGFDEWAAAGLPVDLATDEDDKNHEEPSP
ncbi:MAG: rhodanese-like domain-containing protein [Phycisphaerales bacterium]